MVNISQQSILQIQSQNHFDRKLFRGFTIEAFKNHPKNHARRVFSSALFFQVRRLPERFQDHPADSNQKTLTRPAKDSQC
jgi:hypothetical protein